MPGRTSQLVTVGEIRWLLSQWRLEPQPNSPFSGLADVAPESDPQSLRERGLVEEPWTEAMVSLCRPNRKVRVIVPGPDESAVSIYFGRSGSRPQALVGCWPEDGRLRISFPWTASDILDGTAETLAGSFPALADPFEATLTVAGLVALTAAVDVLREAIFTSLLQRAPDIELSFTRAQLKQQLSKGLAGADMRWTVTLIAMLMPAEGSFPPEALEEGIAELETAGLISTKRRRLQPTETLQRLAAFWRNPLPAVAHESVIVDGARVLDYNYIVTLRGDGPLWVFDFWRGPGKRLQATLSSLDGDTYLEVLASVLGANSRTSAAPAAAPDVRDPNVDDWAILEQAAPAAPAPASAGVGACTSCGAALKPDSLFCTDCGAQVQRTGTVAPPAFCTACGKPIKPGGNSCTVCGTPVKGGSANG